MIYLGGPFIFFIRRIHTHLCIDVIIHWYPPQSQYILPDSPIFTNIRRKKNKQLSLNIDESWQITWNTRKFDTRKKTNNYRQLSLNIDEFWQITWNTRKFDTAASYAVVSFELTRSVLQSIKVRNIQYDSSLLNDNRWKSFRCWVNGMNQYYCYLIVAIRALGICG